MATLRPAPPPPMASLHKPPGPGTQAKRFAFGKPHASIAGDVIVLNAVEGWGKTTAGCYAAKPLILMARGETGYLTLRKSGRVPDVDTVTNGDGEPSTLNEWQEVMDVVDSLAGDDHETYVFDALSGFERLCHEHVCRTQFGGDWGEKGFASFQKGYDISVGEWCKLLAKLEQIKGQGKTILMLSHSKVRPFRNPLGADYDKFVADCHDKTWSVTAKWADAVLFGTYLSYVDTARSSGNIAKDKGKGIGGTERVLYTESRDAFVAKNRYGMDESINIAGDPAEVWNTIWAQLRPTKGQL